MNDERKDTADIEESPLTAELKQIETQLRLHVPRSATAVPPEFLQAVNQRVRIRRQSRLVMIASVTVCAVLMSTWMLRPPVVDSDLPTIGGLENGRAVIVQVDSGDAPSTGQKDDASPQWVTLDVSDLQQLAAGRPVERLKCFAGRAFAIVPVLTSDGTRLQRSWMATTVKENVIPPEELTTLDHKLIRKPARPAAAETDSTVVL